MYNDNRGICFEGLGEQAYVVCNHILNTLET